MVRSNEGLAYNTGRRFGQGVYDRGDSRCWLQSKSNSSAHAAKIVIDAIKRPQAETVAQEDISAIVAYDVESFPQRFETKM